MRIGQLQFDGLDLLRIEPRLPECQHAGHDAVGIAAAWPGLEDDQVFVDRGGCLGSGHDIGETSKRSRTTHQRRHASGVVEHMHLARQSCRREARGKNTAFDREADLQRLGLGAELGVIAQRAAGCDRERISGLRPIETE